MIIQTTRISRAGGVAFLARHLLDKLGENESIEVLAGDRSALHDAHTFAELKRCQYSLRHLSISPEKPMSPAQLIEFLRAVDDEFHIGADRPRLIVRHIKEGRAHFHLAVGEVDPNTLRVLDCRNDYARLENLARCYEADHGECVQPTRPERQLEKVVGFSDVGRKRAERVSRGFDRTRLKTAFAAGSKAFHLELKIQGLHIIDGEKGPILVTANGSFVAAANRVAGVRSRDFMKFMETIQNEQSIGNQTRAPGYAGDDGGQHDEAPATVIAARSPGRPRQDRATHGTAAVYPRQSATDCGRAEEALRKSRSIVPALSHPQFRERLFLHRLTKVDLDDLLRRAQQLAFWMRSAFEQETHRLARQIAEVRQKRKSFPPADAAQPSQQTYNHVRRMRR